MEKHSANARKSNSTKHEKKSTCYNRMRPLAVVQRWFTFKTQLMSCIVSGKLMELCEQKELLTTSITHS